MPRCSSADGCARDRSSRRSPTWPTPTGAELLCETFPARLARGAGRPPVERLGYLAEFAALRLDGIRHLVLLDAKSPVSFFAYPGKLSDLVPEGCTVHPVAGAGDDVTAAVGGLVELIGAAPGAAVRQERRRSRIFPPGH